jgi:hypothetical protein
MAVLILAYGSEIRNIIQKREAQMETAWDEIFAVCNMLHKERSNKKY